MAFARALRAYGGNPKNAGLSEHEHLGPYQYLKFMTWTEPKLDKHAVIGAPSDFLRLADVVAAKVATTTGPFTFELDTEYAPSNEYVLVVQVVDEPFDPAAADPYCHDA